MSEEFGTVSAKTGERARELGRLREHYKNHREALNGLMGDAPSEHLASEYQRLIGEIDAAVRKIDELDTTVKTTSTTPAAAASADTNPMYRPQTRPGATAPGSRPLVRPTEPDVAPPSGTPGLTVAMMIIAGVIVLGAIGYLVWRPRSTPKAPEVVEQPVTTGTNATSATAPPTIPAAAPAALLKVTPALADYGVIRKGTRAVRQFEVVNSSGAPVELQVARSACKCLFYDYKSKLTPNAKETITVTIDGARAKAGPLSEQVEITAKGNPSVNATFTVQATIR